MCQFCGDKNHKSFVHLHNHTTYSFLDGMSSIEKMLDYTKDVLHQPALAITDHAGMFGAYDFYQAAVQRGVKPILGMEGYLAPDSRFGRDKDTDKKPFHLLMWAENNTGYDNLMKISSSAWLEGFYYRPRTDMEFLANHSEGIIVSSGCLASQVPSLFMNGKFDEAESQIQWWKDIFPDRFYLEMQYRLKSKDQRNLNKWLVTMSKKHKVSLIATSDSHYIQRRDADVHDTLLCIQTGAFKQHTNRMKFDEDTYYLIDTMDMINFFNETPSAITNTLEIAERCNVTLQREGYYLPDYQSPDRLTNTEFLRELCMVGADWRYGDNVLSNPEIMNRIDYELSVINRMGFDTYFLVVWDLCEYSRHVNIWWNVRGSGAGSVVAYCLGITSVEPFEHALFFERFLNPGRVTMPDIDLDFQDNRRHEIIDYLVERYGDDRVASIITFGTMGAKAAIRDVGRALNISKDFVDSLTSKVGNHNGKSHAIKTYIDESDVLQSTYNNDPVVKNLLDIAMELQGIQRHTSTHAAGIIVSPVSLSDIVPLYRLTGKKAKEAGDEQGTKLSQVTQYPMESLEELGLLKLDILGISTLTVMQKVCENIKERHGVELHIDNIPYHHTGNEYEDAMLDDAFRYLWTGHTSGIFQVEGSGLTNMLMQMKPTVFDHIVAAIALYRPGPMGIGAPNTYIRRLHGTEATVYVHPKLEPILKDTYGLIVYQEQIMQIASLLFGYEPGEADQIRKAVSKKRESDLIKNRDLFLERGPQNGIDIESSEKIWDEIVFFAEYGFNRCLVGDTKITFADGTTLSIADIVNERITGRVLSLDVDSMNVVKRPIVDWFDNGIKHVYRLTTSLGYSVVATGNHPFLTKDGWVEMSGLSNGQHIATRHSPNADTDMLTSLKCNSDVFWDSIVSIESCGEQNTYDISISDTHSFVANGIFVHNSHSTDYAKITMQTAYLKCHYTVEYMLALMQTYSDNSDRLATQMLACRDIGIELLPPDLNASGYTFEVEDVEGRDCIRFGLTQISHVGHNPASIILESRPLRGFKSLNDFLLSVDLKSINKTAIENMIKVGVFNEIADVNQFMSALENLRKYMAKKRKIKQRTNVGQLKLFDSEEIEVLQSVINLSDFVDNNIKPFTAKELVEFEKDLLGVYVTARPTDAYRSQFEDYDIMPIDEILNDDNQAMFNGARVHVGGMISRIKLHIDKKGNEMAFVAIEDANPSASTLEATIFSKQWSKYNKLVEGDVVVLNGKLDNSYGGMKMLVDNIQILYNND